MNPVELQALSVRVGEADDRLVAFGYAPGMYTGGRCRTCAAELQDIAKRAWRCKPCAEAMLVDEGLRCSALD